MGGDAECGVRQAVLRAGCQETLRAGYLLLQFLGMDREPYRKRAWERIRRETGSSIRGRIAPLVISLIGIAMRSVYSWLHLHKQIKETVEIALISGFWGKRNLVSWRSGL